MAVNIDRFKKDIDRLQRRGGFLECAMIRDVHGISQVKEALGSISDEDFEKVKGEIPDFKNAYESWYSECISVIEQILPSRLFDFKKQYEKPKNRKSVDFETYVIEDYMIGLKVSSGITVKADRSAAFSKLQNQTAILAATIARFESSLFEIRQMVQADLFDCEIEKAKELFRHGFERAAGAIAGVVLEKHLSQVCEDHKVVISKKNPSIGDFNDGLKSAAVIDVPQWRHISMLADIRNICDHNKKSDPTLDQVSDLIDGVYKIVKTVV